jgi:hypothetical protein
MGTFYIGLLIGLFIGAYLGLIVTCLLVISKER